MSLDPNKIHSNASIDRAIEGLLGWISRLDWQILPKYHGNPYGETRPLRDFLLGAPEEKIESVETLLGQKLPYAYRAFLSAMGEFDIVGLQISHFHRGWTAEDEVSTKSSETLEETLAQFYPDDPRFHPVWIIYDHGGAWFNFISFTEGDNPPVYSIAEEKNDLRIADPNLIDYIFMNVMGNIEDAWDEMERDHPPLPSIADFVPAELIELYDMGRLVK